MAIYNDIFSTLKALDANNTSAVVAAACQAFQWEPSGVARFCRLINADPTEVDAIVRSARAANDTSAPWFPPS